MKGALLAATSDKSRWDDHVKDIQLILTQLFLNRQETPTDLFYCYKPRSGADVPQLDVIKNPQNTRRFTDALKGSRR